MKITVRYDRPETTIYPHSVYSFETEKDILFTHEDDEEISIVERRGPTEFVIVGKIYAGGKVEISL